MMMDDSGDYLDELVRGIISRLPSKGISDKPYIVFEGVPYTLEQLQSGELAGHPRDDVRNHARHFVEQVMHALSMPIPADGNRILPIFPQNLQETPFEIFAPDEWFVIVMRFEDAT